MTMTRMLYGRYWVYTNMWIEIGVGGIYKNISSSSYSGVCRGGVAVGTVHRYIA